jgi:iron complex outermembrane receptor protein
LDQNQVVDTLTWSLGPITIKNIAGWKGFHRLWANEAIGSPLDIQYSAALEYHQSGTEESEELQASGKALGDKLDWIAGLFYFDNIFSQQLFGSAFGWLDRDTPKALSITHAAYAQGSYQLPIDGLSFALGVRYTDDFRSMNKFQYGLTPTTCTLTLSPVGPAVPPPNCYFYAQRTFDQVTYNATPSYQIDPLTMVYVSNSRGYRAGGFNIAQSDLVGYLQGYKPEIVENYEIGLKRDWIFGDARLRTNIAAYDQKYTNIVRELQEVTAGAPFAVLTNGPKADIKGAEVEIGFAPVKHVDLGLSFAYVDPKYTAPFFPIPSFNEENNQFALVPHTTLTANVKYTLPLDPHIGDISLGANYYYQSRMWYDDASQGNNCGNAYNSPCGPLNYYSQKPYGILGLRLDWKNLWGSKFDADLWTTNVTNTEYNTSAGAVVSVLGFENVMGPPRFVGADLKYSW